MERGLIMRRTQVTKLTYRGVNYESQAGLLSYLLNKIKKSQRLEKELKHDLKRLTNV
jgi:DNA anti-recombination protein RmuC